MNAEWRREVQVPLGVLAHAGTATAGQALEFNARLGVWHEVAAMAPAMRWRDALGGMKNLLLAPPRGPAILGAAAVLLLVLLLVGLLVGWVSSWVRGGKGTTAISVGSPWVMGAVAAGDPNLLAARPPKSAEEAGRVMPSASALASSLDGTPEGLSSPPQSSAPLPASAWGDAAAEPVVRASPAFTGKQGAGESPELVPSRVLQAARSPVLPTDSAVAHGLPAAPNPKPAPSLPVERLPAAVASGGRTAARPGEHLAEPRAASRGHEPIAGAALSNPAPRRAHAASHQREPRADKKPARSTDTPVAGAAERGRPISRPEEAVASGDFRLAPFGALSGRTGVAGRDVLVAIKDASTVIVANQRGMPTPFRLGEKLPSGAVLLSIHPRLESAETDRGVIRLE